MQSRKCSTLRPRQGSPASLDCVTYIAAFYQCSPRIMTSLRRNLRKEEPKTFQALTDDDMKFIIELKNAVTNPPVPGLPLIHVKYALYTDKYDTEVVCAMLQTQDDETHRLIWHW